MLSESDITELDAAIEASTSGIAKVFVWEDEEDGGIWIYTGNNEPIKLVSPIENIIAYLLCAQAGPPMEGVW